MLVLAKFLHFVGLMLGAGASLGSMTVVRQIRKSAGAPSPQLLALRPVFAHAALVGVVLIWLTGLWLYSAKYAGTSLGGAFHAKLGVAALLLVVVITMNVVGRRAARAGAPVPTWLPKLGMTSPVLLLTAVALAVYVFN